MYHSDSKPYELEVGEYAKHLATREYWDDFSYEWSGRHTMDQKLIYMAGFVNMGGDLLWVIKQYAKDRSRDYRFCIHGSISKYLFRMISEGLTKEERAKDDSGVRMMFLDRDELVELLTEELKRKVTYDLVCNHNTRSVEKEWYVKKPTEFDDTVLAKIEQAHKQAHPDETVEDKRRYYERWLHECMF